MAFHRDAFSDEYFDVIRNMSYIRLRYAWLAKICVTGIGNYKCSRVPVLLNTPLDFDKFKIHVINLASLQRLQFSRLRKFSNVYMISSDIKLFGPILYHATFYNDV